MNISSFNVRNRPGRLKAAGRSENLSQTEASMRLNFVVLGSVLFATSLAVAQPAALPPLDQGSIPAQCQGVATVPPDAKIATPGLAALKLTADDAGIKALSDAAKPSLDLLDEVIKANDATLSPIANKARADLMVSMAVRLRNSIPPVTMQT